MMDSCDWQLLKSVIMLNIIINMDVIIVMLQAV